MKTILGAFAVSLSLFAACGGDSGSSSSPPGPGEALGGGGGGAEDSDDSSRAGEAGQATTLPVTNGGEGGAAPLSDGGATDDGGAGAAPTGDESVSGHIQTFTGAPLPGAVVMIDGTSVLTDDDGAFTIDDVPETYDVTVIYEDVASNWREVEIVDGLKTRELSLRLWMAQKLVGAAAVSGKIAAIPKGHEALVQVVGDHVLNSAQSLLAGDAAYSLNGLQWEGGKTAAAEVLALEWTPGNDGPVSYDGFARQSIELSAGADLIGTNLVLTKPAQKTVTGTVFAEGSPKLFGYLNLGKVTMDVPLKAGAFSAVVPDIGEAATISLIANFSDGDNSSVTSPVTSLAPLALETPPLPKQILPVKDAQVTAKTEFSFSHAGNMAMVWWSAGPWLVLHITDKTTVTLPDLTAQGIVWTDPHGDSGFWAVDTYAPAETPEAFLTLLDGSSPALTHMSTNSASVSRGLYLPK